MDAGLIQLIIHSKAFAFCQPNIVLKKADDCFNTSLRVNFKPAGLFLPTI